MAKTTQRYLNSQRAPGLPDRQLLVQASIKQCEAAIKGETPSGTGLENNAVDASAGGLCMLVEHVSASNKQTRPEPAHPKCTWLLSASVLM